ncbi:uncharacterized protein LOC113276253 [Papaver somniferum]|uniref:uncharacterized protein LOC113276253 n=1 Tax=Papaver somniferum TaxID=3469 RepID=UPI000E6FB426|nr:uncharacterized protein LOC113276253 [Papaver somniferum]
MSSHYPYNSSDSSPNPLFPSIYSKSSVFLETPIITNDPIVVKSTTSGTIVFPVLGNFSMAELQEGTLLQLEALKKEGKTRSELENCCRLYRFHFKENHSPTREYYLQKFSWLMTRDLKKLRLILFIKGTTSIPLAIEEEDDSLEELIPSFLFDEENDTTTDVVKSISYVLNEQENNNSTTAPCFQFEEVVESVVNYLGKVKLKKQMKLGECLNIILNSSCSLFDRGKNKLKLDFILGFPYYIGLQFLDRLCKEIVQKLISNSGYQSGSLCNDSIDCMLDNRGSITTDWCMFDKMIESEG